MLISLVSKNLGDIVSETSSQVVLLFMKSKNLLVLIEELIRRNVTGKTWLATESWVVFPDLGSARYATILQGSLGFAVRSGQIPGLLDFLITLRPSALAISGHTEAISARGVFHHPSRWECIFTLKE